MVEHPLTASFLDAAEGRGCAAEGLESEIERLFDDAQKAWPEFAVTPAAFAVHLGERVEGGERPSALHSTDLYLALGCVVGDRYAFQIFEARCMSQVPRLVAHLRLAADLLDELAQSLRAQLL